MNQNITKAAIIAITLISMLGLARWASASDIEKSIARLNHAGFNKLSHCTASLLAPYAAITAKHCIRPGQHLLFGYAKGEWLEHRRVSQSVLHETKDLAVVCFREKSNQEPLKLHAIQHVEFENEVSVFGYPRSRSHALQKLDCTISKNGKKGLLNCPLEHGMSGGPVMAMDNGLRELVGVASATTKTHSQIELIGTWVPEVVKGCSLD